MIALWSSLLYQIREKGVTNNAIDGMYVFPQNAYIEAHMWWYLEVETLETCDFSFH